MAAAGEEDGRQVGVGGQLVEGGQALGVAAGEAHRARARHRRQVARRHRLEAQPLELGEAAPQPLGIDRAGERRHPHARPRADRGREDGRRPS